MTTKQAGMTLVELTIATTILAVMLLGMTQFFVNLVHQDRESVSIQDSTQNVLYALNDITTEARLASAVYVDTPDTNNLNGSPFSQVCLYIGNGMQQYFAIAPSTAGSGNNQILYKRIYQSAASAGLSPSNPCPLVLSVDPTQDVPVVSSSDVPAGSLTGLNVADFQAVKSVNHVVPTLTVRLGMTTNLADLKSGSTTNCTAGTTEFCSVTTFETTISLRAAQNVGP